LRRPSSQRSRDTWSGSVEKPGAAGLTLPRAVLLLQPLLRRRDGRCRTFRQAVDLDELVLFPLRE
jgi:hypothetical protein